jgi:hypothetical protein
VRYPLPTGEASRLLEATEPQLSEAVRRGKVEPRPLVIAGRRLWFAEHLLQAAEALDILTPELRAEIEASVPAAGEHILELTRSDSTEADSQEASLAS